MSARDLIEEWLAAELLDGLVISLISEESGADLGLLPLVVRPHGQLVDPFGLCWAIMTHIEDVSEEEMTKRAAKMFGGG